MLILDEPTSGVDPVARDGFWELLIRLSRENGVTIFLSTHFMNEAERCDRMSMMHAGKVLAKRSQDRPKRGMPSRSRRRSSVFSRTRPGGAQGRRKRRTGLAAETQASAPAQGERGRLQHRSALGLCTQGSGGDYARSSADRLSRCSVPSS